MDTTLGITNVWRYHTFMTERYKLQQGAHETWMVIDARTERAAEMGSRTVTGMNRKDAEELAELLNKLERQRLAGRSEQDA